SRTDGRHAEEARHPRLVPHGQRRRPRLRQEEERRLPVLRDGAVYAGVFVTLLAERHRTFRQPEVVSGSRLRSRPALSAPSDRSPLSRRRRVPSRCRPASKPRTAPGSSGAATCTAPSPGTGTAGWSAPRGPEIAKLSPVAICP